MKPLIILLVSLLSFQPSIFAADDSKSAEKESPQWNLSQPAYGQFRLVPDKIVPHVTTPQDWSGPWTEFGTFLVQIQASRGHQTSPGDFDYVDPSIGLRGVKPSTTESSNSSVRLFDRASTESDIKVDFAPVPTKIELDREYLAAEILGKDSITTWKVYVRFVVEKPSYIRSSSPQAAN